MRGSYLNECSTFHRLTYGTPHRADSVESRSESDERSPQTPNNNSGDDAGSADDRDRQIVVPAASIWRGDKAPDAANADGNVLLEDSDIGAIAVCTLNSEIKQHAAVPTSGAGAVRDAVPDEAAHSYLEDEAQLVWTEKPSTFDALAALVSPLRGHQVLGMFVFLASLLARKAEYEVLYCVDDWTGHEIGLFEEAYERFGKDFYALAEQVRFTMENLLGTLHRSLIVAFHSSRGRL
ncbi:hypothetical protein GQ600_16002 [Phytophthora cactorum]|nr:hypothetical protein GQ600_16002 [Phytophthora cactorum]